MLQFTNETLAEHVATLTRVVVQSRDREVDQHEGNFNMIAGIFSKIANFVNSSNMMLDREVSDFRYVCNIKNNYIHVLHGMYVALKYYFYHNRLCLM